jgi:Na+-transporting NADH:ubiquinone oxidoreductase subunit NqrE
MKDYKFIIGIRLYLIIIHYSIFVGYVYGSYKNYNIKESIMISTIVGIVTPFFLPIRYILDAYGKEEKIEHPYTFQAPLIVFKYLYSEHKKMKPQKFRV